MSPSVCQVTIVYHWRLQRSSIKSVRFYDLLLKVYSQTRTKIILRNLIKFADKVEKGCEASTVLTKNGHQCKRLERWTVIKQHVLIPVSPTCSWDYPLSSLRDINVHQSAWCRLMFLLTERSGEIDEASGGGSIDTFTLCGLQHFIWFSTSCTQQMANGRGGPYQHNVSSGHNIN